MSDHSLIECFVEGISRCFLMAFLGAGFVLLVSLAVILWPVTLLTLLGRIELRKQDAASEEWAKKFRSSGDVGERTE